MQPEAPLCMSHCDAASTTPPRCMFRSSRSFRKVVLDSLKISFVLNFLVVFEGCYSQPRPRRIKIVEIQLCHSHERFAPHVIRSTSPSDTFCINGSGHDDSIVADSTHCTCSLVKIRTNAHIALEIEIDERHGEVF